MSDHLKKAIEIGFDLNLWPVKFIQGSSAVAIKNCLNVNSVLLAFLTGTSIFAGKKQDQSGGFRSYRMWITLGFEYPGKIHLLSIERISSGGNDALFLTFNHCSIKFLKIV